MQPGLRRKPALTGGLLDDYLAGKTVQEAMDPESLELFGIAGPPKEPEAIRDRDRSDNRRVPSHDEPPKAKKKNTGP